MSTPAKQAIRWLVRESKPARLFLYSTVILGILQAILLIGQVFCMARILSLVFIKTTDFNALLPYFWGFIAFIVARTAATWGRQVLSFHIGEGVRARIRQRLFNHVLSLGPGHGLQSGALSSSLLEQVEALQDFYQFYLPARYLAILVPLVILIAVFPVNWIAGLILLITAPLIPLFMALVGMGASAVHKEQLQTLARMSARFLDLLQGLTTLKQFGRSREQMKTVQTASDIYRHKTMKVLKIAFLSSGVLELFASGAIALVAIFLGLALLQYMGVAGHGITLNIALFILLLTPEFYAPLREMGAQYHAKSQAVGAAEALLEVFAVKPQGLSNTHGKVFRHRVTEFDLALKNLSFGYDSAEPSSAPVLDQISLDIPQGAHIAIVGASGVGKSTLLKLLMGFLRPTSGEIFVAGSDLSSLNTTAWRRCFSWIGQSPKLFTGTIFDNILLANPSATQAQVIAAAEQAFVMAFAQQLPQGLATPVGELGAGLSGGQIQRIALARAYLKNAPVLLLDEPMASLDAASEAYVSKALAKLCQGRTVIHLTHRFSSIVDYDRIYVLQNGRLVEQGNFKKLVANRGPFYRLYDGQEG